MPADPATPREVILKPGWFSLDHARAKARIKEWQAQRVCTHVLRPVYHSWECIHCGKMFND